MRSIKGTVFPDNILEDIYSFNVLPGDRIFLLSQDQLDGLNYAISTLSEREQYVLNARYKELKTYEVIGKEIGIQKEPVRQIISKLCRKLRYPSRFRYLQYGFQGYKSMLVEQEKEAQERKERLLKAEKERSPLDTPLSQINLSFRAYNCLTRSGNNTVGDVLGKIKADRMWYGKVRNFGKKSAQEVYGALVKMNLLDEQEQSLLYGTK